MDILILSATALANAINSAMPGSCVALTIGRSARDGLNAGLSVTLGVIFVKLVLVCVALGVMQGMVAVNQWIS